MKYRDFGKTSIKVSEIALGTMHFKWIVSEKASLKLLDHYFESEGNFIDTSDMYTQWGEGLKGGEAETILGKWFKLRKNREKIILTTKVRAKMWNGSDGEGLSRKHILRACDESLRRLQTDYIDIYMSHWSDINTPIEETISAYQELIKQGKVRFIGFSNYSATELKEALEVDSKYGSNCICIEPYYNLIQRNPFEKELLPLVQQYHLAVTPYSPLAGGFLTGVYRKNKHLPVNIRATFAKEKMTKKNLELIEVMHAIAKRHKCTVAQVSLAWLLHHPWMTAPIVGPESREQLDENLLGSDIRLSEEDISMINTMTTE